MMGAFHDISRVAETDPCQVRDLASKLLATAWNLSPGKRKPKSTAIHPVVPSRSMIEQVGMVEVELVACVIWGMAMVCRYNIVLYFCIHVLSPCHGTELLTTVFLQGNSPFSTSSTKRLERPTTPASLRLYDSLLPNLRCPKAPTVASIQTRPCLSSASRTQ